MDPTTRLFSKEHKAAVEKNRIFMKETTAAIREKNKKDLEKSHEEWSARKEKEK